MPDNPNYHYSADYKKFKADSYSAKMREKRKSGKDDEVTYKDIVKKLNNGEITQKQAQKQAQNATFESASEVNEAFKNRLLTSGEAHEKAKEVLNSKKTPSLPELNKRLDLGKISSQKGAKQGVILIAAASKGKITKETVDRVRKKIIPNREVYSKKHMAEKLRHGGYLSAKFTAKTAKRGITVAGRMGVGLVKKSFSSQIGGRDDMLQDELSTSGKSIAYGGLRHARNFAGSSILSIRSRINLRKEFKASTVTEKDLLKNQNAKTSRQQKKSDKQLARKMSKSNVHYASDLKFSHTPTVAGVAKGVKNVGKAGVSSSTSAGRAFSGRVSKIATDNLGATDPGVQQLGSVSKAGAKLTFKAGEKIGGKVGKQVGKVGSKAAKKAAQSAAKGAKAATSTITAAITAAVSAVTTAVSSVVTTIISNPVIMIVLIIIIIFVVLIISLVTTCSATIPVASAANLDSYEFLKYQDEETIFKAEEMYADAETELSQYASKMELEEAKKWLDPDNKYGLTEDNTFLSHTYDATYHNPYNFIAYLCVKYGKNWTLNDVEYECDYNNSDSMMHMQYTLGVSFGADDAASVKQALKDTIEAQIDSPYNTGGRGYEDEWGVWSGSYNYCGSWPIFDCSGLTSYTYHKVMGMELDYNVSDAYGTSGQWELGDAIEKQDGESDEDFIKRLEVGDLLFMSPNASAGGRPGHVGMYVGNGEMVDAHYLYTDSAGHYRGIVAKETLYIDRSSEYDYYRDPSSIMGVRRIIGSDDDTYNYADDINDMEDEDSWIVTVSFKNDGMDAAARAYFDDDEDALNTYLTMCYYYGVAEGTAEEDNPFAAEWPYERYQTYSDSFDSLQDFLDAKGVSSDFDVDKVYSSTSIIGGAIGSLPNSGDYFFTDESTSALWPLPLAVHTSRVASGYADISSDYGWHDGAHPNGHNGTDFPAPDGTDVYAIYGGSVYETREHNVHYGSSQGGSINECGNYIIVQSEVNIGGKTRQLFIRYQHLRECPDLSKSTNVTQGTVVGHVGNTGYSTGNHLHISVWLDAVYGTSVGGMDTLFPNAASHGVTWVAHW